MPRIFQRRPDPNPPCPYCQRRDEWYPHCPNRRCPWLTCELCGTIYDPRYERGFRIRFAEGGST